MISVNDQHPFDVAPDDEHRPAADAAQQTPEQRSPSEPLPADEVGSEQTGAETPATDPVQATAEDDAVDDAVDRGRRRHRRIAALGVAAAVIFTAGAGGGAVASLALARSTTTATADGGSASQGGSTAQDGGRGGFGGSGSSGMNGFGRFGSDGQDSSGSGSSTSTGTTAASASQSTGLVTIVSELGYESGEAAGTGIVLTSTGRILTNNHVIDGSTAIRVTVQSTGRSYTADVVGTDATKDVAVLQLEGASGLTTADLATGEPAVGDDVTAVGNANGTGTLSAATGSVSALDQTITTSSEGGTAGETLHGLIEVDADVVSGDSGGAVKDADGDVLGVTTAASSGTSDVTGYAIPIADALSVAKQIVAGDDTADITIGLPAFLGVSIDGDASGTNGAVVGQVLQGTAAAKTDLAAGDAITKVDGTTISSADGLSTAIASHAVGDRVTITWTDTDGEGHTATVTLLAGPAD